MKSRFFRTRLVALALLVILAVSGASFAAEPENALTFRSNSGLYFALKANDVRGFIQWLVSRENMNLVAKFVPDFDKDMIDMVASVIDDFPLKAAAFNFGISLVDGKPEPYVQAAFTLHPSTALVADKIEVASAEAKDIAAMLIGSSSPLVSLLETMIKVEHEPGKILRINNEILVKAKDGVVFAGTDIQSVNDAYETFTTGKDRFIDKFGRKFSADNFALIYLERDTVIALNNSSEKDIQELNKYWANPLRAECALEYQPDKLTFGFTANLLEALNPEIVKEYIVKLDPVRGGNILLNGIGGDLSPFFALGTVFNFGLADVDEDMLKDMAGFFKFLQRFDISREEFFEFMKGAFSIVVGTNSVPVEGFKIPSVFLTKTGAAGLAEQIFKKIASKPFLTEVSSNSTGWTRLLQVDSSLSPVSFLVGLRGDSLGLGVLELSATGENHALKAAFENLLARKSIASFWLDFEAIQSWLKDSTNGVMTFLTPLAAFSGYGDVMSVVVDILNSKLSVPSVAFYSPNLETFFAEFDLADVPEGEGIFPKLVTLYQKLDAKGVFKNLAK